MNSLVIIALGILRVRSAYVDETCGARGSINGPSEAAVG